MQRLLTACLLIAVNIAVPALAQPGTNQALGSDVADATSDHWVGIFGRVGNEWKFRVLSVGDDTPPTRR